MSAKLSTEEFIDKATKIYGTSYDYSLVDCKNTYTKVKIICPEHGVFEQYPNKYFLGVECRLCVKRTKAELRIKKFIIESNNIHNFKYDYSLAEYSKSYPKVKIICQEHGVFEQLINNHLKGHGCPKCYHNKTSTRQTYSTEEFIEKANNIHSNKYDYSLVDYIKGSLKVKIICPEHGVFEQKPYSHMNGGGCLCCANQKISNQKKSSINEFIEKANNIHSNKYDYSLVEYNNGHEKAKIICPEHDVFEQQPYSHLAGHACPECKGASISLKQTYTTEEFIEKVNNIHNNKYDYSLVDYIKGALKVKIICTEHGVFDQAGAAHLSGQGCPKCVSSIRRSKSEIEVFEFVSSLTSCVHSDRTIIAPKELDIYCPNEKIAFEFNGMYWHSSSSQEEDTIAKTRHVEKTNSCNENGVRLFHIQENEWINKKEIWKSVIRNALGKSNKIYARKCAIKPVNSKDANLFCEENHLQGKCVSSINYGLFFGEEDEEELVSIMTFSKARYSKADYELIRMCNKLNLTVVGGASKLLKHFKKNHQGTIVSYANKRWSVGNLYEKLGFVHSHDSNPCYWYFKGGKIYHRSVFMKHKLKNKVGKELESFDLNLTEVQNMYNNNYRRIWDSGNKVYLMS